MSVKKRALTNEEMNSAAGGRFEKASVPIIYDDKDEPVVNMFAYWVIDNETNKPIACYDTPEAANMADKVYHLDHRTVLKKGHIGFDVKFEDSIPYDDWIKE